MSTIQSIRNNNNIENLTLSINQLTINNDVLSCIRSITEERFLNLARKSLPPQMSISERSIQTDCFLTTRALSIIFSDEQHGKLQIAWLCSKSLTHITLRWPDGLEEDLELRDIFTGPFICFGQDSMDESKKMVENQISDYIEQHCELVATLDKETKGLFIAKMFREIPYDINLQVHQSLTNRIRFNKDLVNSEVNYIYYIVIKRPHQANKPAYIYHALTLVQSYNTSLKGTTYNLFQSVIDSMTLFQFLSKNYEHKDYLNQNELTLFLEDLKKITCKAHCDDIKTVTERCFGYPIDQKCSQTLYRKDPSRIEGFSLRYVVDQTNPNKYLTNYHNFMNS